MPAQRIWDLSLQITMRHCCSITCMGNRQSMSSNRSVERVGFSFMKSLAKKFGKPFQTDNSSNLSVYSIQKFPLYLLLLCRGLRLHLRHEPAIIHSVIGELSAAAEKLRRRCRVRSNFNAEEILWKNLGRQRRECSLSSFFFMNSGLSPYPDAAENLPGLPVSLSGKNPSRPAEKF